MVVQHHAQGRHQTERAIGEADLVLHAGDVCVPSVLDDAAVEAMERYAEAEKASGFDPRADWGGDRR